jgi:6-phospho-beta-glucosidase
MKAVFVGGGAVRLVGILRAAFHHRGMFEGGEINLYDINVPRAEAVAKMLMKTPEFARVKCKLTWGTTLEKALEGADMVGVILMAGSQKTAQLGDKVSRDHGFLSSDNVSPNGAFLGIKGGPILLNVAKKMEQYCPQAWLVDFANPIAVHSAMINNHTAIEALGVCGGYTNHQWDLGRIMFGKDEQSTAFDVETAGINHLSFILKGTCNGQDLFKALDRRLDREWTMCPLQKHLPAWSQKSITRSVTNLVRFYRQLGVVIFSTEGDGMAHLYYDELFQMEARESKPRTLAQINASVKNTAKHRKEFDQTFQALLNTDIDPKFWDTGWKDRGMGWADRADRDIFVELLRGLAGETIKVVTSRLNNGAVAGFTDRTCLEYSQIVKGGVIRPAGHYEVPGVVHGLISSLATHQTMLADAIATDDPKLLAKALLAYPVKQFSKEARSLFKDLAKINRDEMSPGLRRVGEYL